MDLILYITVDQQIMYIQYSVIFIIITTSKLFFFDYRKPYWPKCIILAYSKKKKIANYLIFFVAVNAFYYSVLNTLKTKY